MSSGELSNGENTETEEGAPGSSCAKVWAAAVEGLVAGFPRDVEAFEPVAMVISRGVRGQNPVGI